MEGRIAITESEILRALQEAASAAPDGAPDAFTVAELCAVMGRGEKAVRNLLRPLVQSGRVEPVMKAITDLAGRPQRVPAYRAA